MNIQLSSRTTKDRVEAESAMRALQIEVFRREGDDIVPIDRAAWEAFRSGQAPLPRCETLAHTKVDLLIVTTRDGVCELVEPISVHIDDHGYLQRLHVHFDALPDSVLDARTAFVSRYLRHANHWAVSALHVEKALAHLAAR
jgi:hypothetical protein